MSLINFPVLYIPDPVKGRPLFNGQIYVGEPDLDPQVVANQKQLNIIKSDGTVIAVAQPFLLSAGGVPVYNGNTVRLDVDGNYSIKILDKLGAQAYYIENVFEGEPVTDATLPALLINDLSQAYEFATVAEYKAFATAFPVGKAIRLLDRGAKFTVISGVLTANTFSIIASASVDQSITINVSPEMYMTQFGVPLNGTVTQNAGIQIAFDTCAKGKLYIEGDGSYLIDATANHVSVPGGSTIEWLGDTSFLVNTNNAGNYAGLLIVNANNIKLLSPFIIGDRDTHIDTGAENGHCIQIEGTSTSIHIVSPRLSKSWGDGLYVLNVANLRVDNINTFSTRRNGISIISADGCIINGGISTFSDGTNPRAGIDLEPNNPTQKLKGIIINDFRTANCAIGISVAPISMDSTSNPIDVVINNPVSFNDNRGLQVSTYTDVKGSVVVNNPIAIKSGGNGLLIDKPNINGPNIVINDPVVIDNNRLNSASNTASAGILVFSPVEAVQTTFKLGNVEINGATIKSSGSPLNRSGITVQDGRAIFQGFGNIKITDPKEITTFTGALKLSVVANSGGVDSDIQVIDSNDLFFASPTGTSSVSPASWVSHLSSDAYTGNGNANLSENYPVGSRVRFDKGTNAFTLRIVPALCQTQPLNTVPGQIVDSTLNGSTITLEKFSTTEWRVINLVGTWI
tara:strand:- start:2373 stop:4424 length:2052 start_codon:yes stop_codon:yes gene_type:complete